MMIDASVPPTALRTFTLGLTVAAWNSFTTLHPEIWISHTCDAFAHQVSRELLTRHRSHNPDNYRLSANNDTSTIGEPVPNNKYLHCVSSSFCSGCEDSAALHYEHHTRIPCRAQSPARQRESVVLDAPRDECIMFSMDACGERHAAARPRVAPEDYEWEALAAELADIAFLK
jgi:hypothetical protein